MGGADSGSISNCFSTGTVNGTFCIGGFVGALGDMTTPHITNCYSTGDVFGDVSGSGGFVGLGTGYTSYCYSTGKVCNGLGGGFSAGSNTNGCFFLDSAGQNNGYGTPLSDSQMKLQASFVYWDDVNWELVFWDFVNVWHICENTNYPKLLWQIPAADFVCPDGVNFADFSFFAERWLDIDCAGSNNCDGADLDLSGTVDLNDLAAFVENWLQPQVVFIERNKAANPSPAYGELNVAITKDLSWTAGIMATSHDVYFGTTNPPQFRCNQTGTTYDTGTMDVLTTYYWRIDERSSIGITAGYVWSFTTIPPPPEQAGNPTPANGAISVDLITDLKWTAGSFAASHDVYFGTTNPPPFRLNQTGTTYNTGLMAANTTYYWRVDEKNASGTAEGELWSFTTVSSEANPVALWKFNEGSGTIANDSTGHNHTGTITGASWMTPPGRGLCLFFDNSGDYVTVPDTDALDMSSAITITAWIRPVNFGFNYFILTKQPSGSAGSNYPGNYEFRIESSTGRLNFLHQTSSETTYSTYTSSSALTTGVWQQVAVTLGSGQVNFYINGAPAGTFTQSGTFGILNNEPVRIGKRKDSSSFCYAYINYVRIYSRVLSADEVSMLYQQGR
jgi:hypothetical protein